MAEFKDIASRAIEVAQKQGADAVYASVARSQDVEAQWRKSKVDTLSSAGQSSLVLRLFVDGKYGVYTTSDLRDESVDAFIGKGIAMTRLLERDPARGLADPSRYTGRAELDLEQYDETVAALRPDDLVQKCRQFEDVALARKDISPIDTTISFGATVNESFSATSNGFYGSRKTTLAMSMCEYVVGNGEKKISEYGYSQAKHASDMEPFEVQAADAARYIALKTDQKKIASGRRTLILDRRCAGQFVGRFIIPAFGNALVNRQSYFEGKIGQTVASKLFDLHDSPHLVRGMRSRLYDGAGMATQPRAIFDHGVLTQYYLDNYSARKLGLDATTGEQTNLVLTPGARGLDEMIRDVQDGVYVISFLGGNQDTVRGDFSYGIVGVAIEHGELTTHVSEMNVTGNFMDVMHRLNEVGNDPRTDVSSRIPSLRIDDVSFSGT